MSKSPLHIVHDMTNDLVTIDGVTYHGDVFRHFAIGPVGRWFTLQNRVEHVEGGEKRISVCIYLAPEQAAA